MSKTMKAMTYYGENDVRFEDRPVPTIIDPTDAIIRVTKTTICRFFRGQLLRFPGFCPS